MAINYAEMNKDAQLELIKTTVFGIDNIQDLKIFIEKYSNMTTDIQHNKYYNSEEVFRKGS